MSRPQTLKAELQQRYLVSSKKDLAFKAADGGSLDPNAFQKKQISNAVAAAEFGKVLGFTISAVHSVP